MRAPKTDTGLRQEQIVAAALDLMGTEGVSALSMAGIADRVGIVPSALYRHFKSKDEVLDAVLESLRNRLLKNVAEAVGEMPAAVERLRRILLRHARMLSEYRAIPYVVFSDGIYTGRPDRKAKVADIMASYLDRIGKIIMEGQQDGSIRRDIQPAATAMMFLGMVLPAAVFWNLSEGAFDMVEHVQNAWPAFSRMIAAVPDDPGC